jgi:hypothetical protein
MEDGPYAPIYVLFSIICYLFYTGAAMIRAMVTLISQKNCVGTPHFLYIYGNVRYSRIT